MGLLPLWQRYLVQISKASLLDKIHNIQNNGNYFISFEGNWS